MPTQELTLITMCPHFDLVSWHDTFHGDWHYICAACGKEVTIPIMSILIEEDSKPVPYREATLAARQRMVDLVGDAFGDRWRTQMQREANQWNAKEQPR